MLCTGGLGPGWPGGGLRPIPVRDSRGALTDPVAPWTREDPDRVAGALAARVGVTDPDWLERYHLRFPGPFRRYPSTVALIAFAGVTDAVRVEDGRLAAVRGPAVTACPIPVPRLDDFED